MAHPGCLWLALLPALAIASAPDTSASVSISQHQSAPALTTASAPDTFLSGVRDLAYDAARQLVITAAIGGHVAVIDVADSAAPKLLAGECQLLLLPTAAPCYPSKSTLAMG